jgi:hypothetical protein
MIARLISLYSGADGYAAAAMMGDVRMYGDSSPHRAEVGQAAAEILEEIIVPALAGIVLNDVVAEHLRHCHRHGPGFVVFAVGPG